MITKYKISNINDASISYDVFEFKTNKDFIQTAQNIASDEVFVNSEITALTFIAARLKMCYKNAQIKINQLAEENKKTRERIRQFNKAINSIK